MLEKEIELNGEKKHIQVKSLKGRDAQALWNKLKEFDNLKDNDDQKQIELSESFKAQLDKLLKDYAGLSGEELDELTADDRKELVDYFIEQAQKHVLGFSTASPKQAT